MLSPSDDFFPNLVLGVYAVLLWAWWGFKKIAWVSPLILIDLFVWDGFMVVGAAIICVVLMLSLFGDQYRDGKRPPT